MQKTSKTALLVVFAILLAAFACSFAYAAATMSFPLPAIERALFKNVSFNFNGGHNQNGETEQTQRLWSWAEPTPPLDVEKDGYTLQTWSSNADKTAYSAEWELTHYEITYNLEYGELSSSDLDTLPTSFTIESDPIELPSPSRYAYKFSGWTLEDGTPVDLLDCSGLQGDTDLYAQWTQQKGLKPSTIYLGDDLEPVPYEYCINADEAPKYSAGVWQGTADVDDGEPAYFVGHNPGVFTPVESFTEGSRFAICDDNGNVGVYEVQKIIVILYEGTKWTRELEKLTMPSGEYASLQTCRGDKVYMDIFIGKRIDG